MRRRSRLGVLIRLARLNENRALRTLGEARALAEGTRQSLQTLRGRVDSTRVGAVLTRVEKLDARSLAGNDECARGLGVQAGVVEQALATAHEAEETARATVVETKLRLRMLRSAEAKREAHERRLLRRAELRRVDEAGRGRCRDEES